MNTVDAAMGMLNELANSGKTLSCSKFVQTIIHFPQFVGWELNSHHSAGVIYFSRPITLPYFDIHNGINTRSMQ